jgi:cobalt-zinc-cadmium efflux system outer membrane protein
MLFRRIHFKKRFWHAALLAAAMLSTLWTQRSEAQENPNGVATITMHSAVVEALEHNPTLGALRFEPKAARADEVTAGLRPNPTATVNADLLPSDGLSSKDKNYGISLSFPFELGGKRDARLAFAREGSSLADLQYADALRQTTLAVRLSYIDFASTRARALATQENLGLLDSLVIISKARVAGKDIAQVELTRTEVEREKFALESAKAMEDHRAARTSLFALLGRPAGQVIQLPDTTLFIAVAAISKRELPSLDSLVATASSARTDIQALEANEQLAAANADLQRSLASIDLSISLDYMRSQSITYYGTTLSFPLPLFNRNQGEIEKASIRQEQVKQQTFAALAQLRADVTNAWFDAKNKQHTLRTLVESVLQKSFDVRSAIEYSYRRGGTSLIDFLDAARTYNELRQSYVDALGDYAKSLVTLNAIIGKDIFNEIQ